MWSIIRRKKFKFCLMLWRDINVSDAAMEKVAELATQTKEVALQNRMALDIILAEKGGVCKIVHTE